MDYIQSLYKLTFDPAGGAPWVLLEFGQWIDQELAITLENAVEVINPVDSADAFLRDGKTSVYNFALKAYTTEALDLNARINAVLSLAAAAALTKKPLRMEIQGLVGYFQFTSAFVKSHTPVRVLQSGVARWCREFNIVATGLTYT